MTKKVTVLEIPRKYGTYEVACPDHCQIQERSMVMGEAIHLFVVSEYDRPMDKITIKVIPRAECFDAGKWNYLDTVYLKFQDFAHVLSERG